MPTQEENTIRIVSPTETSKNKYSLITLIVLVVIGLSVFGVIKFKF